MAVEKKYMGLIIQKVVEDFADYAEFCFKTFGDKVKNWMTFNELRVAAALGYDNGLHVPGRFTKFYGNCTSGDSATEPYIVGHNLILAHAFVVQRYRENCTSGVLTLPYFFASYSRVLSIFIYV